jgi:hypothetical protein
MVIRVFSRDSPLIGPASAEPAAPSLVSRTLYALALNRTFQQALLERALSLDTGHSSHNDQSPAFRSHGGGLVCCLDSGTPRDHWHLACHICRRFTLLCFLGHGVYHSRPHSVSRYLSTLFRFDTETNISVRSTRVAGTETASPLMGGNQMRRPASRRSTGHSPGISRP